MANIVTRESLMGDPLFDFRNFLFKVWRTIGLPDPTPLQYDFAGYLMEGVWEQLIAAALNNDAYARRLILMAFRGASKSYVTTAFAVYLLRLNREEIVLVTSATSGYAAGIAQFAWQMVSNFDWLANLKPSNDQRRSAQAFDVAGAPLAQKDESFASESVFGQITGRRATRIIGDDLETPNTSETEGKRSQLRHRMSELGGAIIKPGGSIYLLGTAQTENTVYKEYAEEKGYELRIWPIVYPILSGDPKKDELRRYGPLLAPTIRTALATNPHLAGTSVEPTRFSEGDIIQRRKEWGVVEFDRQFKMFLDAGSGRGHPLHMRDLVVLDLGERPAVGLQFKLPSDIQFAPTLASKVENVQVDALTGDSTLYSALGLEKAAWIPPEAIFGMIDTSGEGEDETAWAIGAGLLGRVFLLWMGASTDGHTPATMKRIAEDGKTWGCQSWVVESNFGQGMFAELLQPVCKGIGYEPEILTERAGNVQKEVRIVNALEPVLTDHRLVVNAEVLRRDFDVDYQDVEQAKRRYYRLTYQLSRMTRAKGCVVHDDRADALAALVTRFEGMLKRRLQEAQREGNVRAIELEGERMIEERRKQGLPLYGLEKIKSVFGRGGQGRKPSGRRR